MDNFVFSFQQNKPKYKQIYLQIRQLIEESRLKEGDSLPSIRTLATSLSVSRNTVLVAYEQLVAEGYIRGEKKRGYFVNPLDPLDPSVLPDFHTTSNPSTAADLIDFRAGAVDQKAFPIQVWRKYANEVLHSDAIYRYGDRQGELELREQLARYLLQARGMKVTADQVVIGSGTQQLLLQLGLLLKKQFSSIYLEDPGYNGARAVFDLHNFTRLSLPVTPDGFHLEVLDQKAKLAYVTPSHHFPYGVSMSIQERHALVKWAGQDGYIVEDDYDGEFRYVQQPFPALASIQTERVIYLGTFSKSLLPSIRISYMVLPQKLMQDFNQTFEFVEQSASTLHQLTLARFMEEGEWSRHIRRMRHIYKRKMSVLVHAFEHYFGEGVTLIGRQSGLYLLVGVATTQTEKKLIEAAEAFGVKVYPTSPYFRSRPEYPHLQLGFSNLSVDEIEEGVRRLSKAWSSSMDASTNK